MPKKYGWGVHYDSEGKIAICPIESPENEKFTDTECSGVKVLNAMRSGRK